MSNYFLSLIILFSSFIFQNNVLVKIDYFDVDNLNNIYVLSDGELIKYNAKGKKLYTYSNNKLGDISYVDISNPLKILAYFKEFNSLLILDNKLTEISNAYKLSNKLEDIDIYCQSSNGGFWAFSTYTNSIIRLDKKLIIQFENPINFKTDSEITCYKMVEHHNNIYLGTNKGIKVFDSLGNLKINIDYVDNQYFQIKENNLISTIKGTPVKINLRYFSFNECYKTLEKKKYFELNSKKILVEENKFTIE